MNASVRNPGPNVARIAAWSAIPLLLCVPLVAMQFTGEVVWSPFDFLVAAAILGGIGLTGEFLFRRSANPAYRLGACAALGAILFTVWSNLAVGIASSESDPFNLSYFALMALAMFAAALVRFRARGLTLVTAAVGAGFVVLAAIASTRGYAIWPQTGVLVAPWLLASVLFALASGRNG